MNLFNNQLPADNNNQLAHITLLEELRVKEDSQTKVTEHNDQTLFILKSTEGFPIIHLKWNIEGILNLEPNFICNHCGARFSNPVMLHVICH